MRTRPGPRGRMMLGAVAVVALVAASCGDDDDDAAGDDTTRRDDRRPTRRPDAPATEAPATEETAARPADGDTLEIAHFVAIQANPVEEVIIQAAQEVADADGNVNVTLFDANSDPQAQIAQCQDALAQNKFDAFVLKAVAGPTMIRCAEDAIAAGIKVVAQGNALGPDPASVELQVDGLSASVIHSAKTNGEGIMELVDLACQAKGEPECEVIYLFGPLAFDYSSISRDVLYAAIEADHPEITVVAEQTQNFSPDEAIAAAQQLLPANPGIDVLALDCSFCAVALVDVLAEMGLSDSVYLLASASDAASIEQVKTGEQFGEVLLLPATEAAASRWSSRSRPRAARISATTSPSTSPRTAARRARSSSPRTTRRASPPSGRSRADPERGDPAGRNLVRPGRRATGRRATRRQAVLARRSRSTT